MGKTLAVDYQGIEIEYDERSSQFVFELRGRERKAITLKAAKEMIDKPEPKAKGPKIEPISAVRYAGDWEDESWNFGKVTSIAEGSYYNIPNVWFVDAKGSRSKGKSDTIYAMTPKNDAIRALIDKENVLIEQAEKRKDKLLESLAGVNLDAFKASA